MINSNIISRKGYSHFHASDFNGVSLVDERDRFSLTVWPDGENGSNEPDACGMVSIEHDELDGEPVKELAVLLDKEAMIKLRDMLNERFPQPA